MNNADLKASYQLIAELLLNPDDRTPNRIEPLKAQVGSALSSVMTHINTFLESPTAYSRDEYVQTLELSPPCPLYLGSYLFDEPSTCNGVGSSGRNAYMLELIGLYQHFELDLASRELPDFLPVMVDFLWISLHSDARNGKALRRWCLENHVLPGMEPLRDSLKKYKSAYQHVVEALRVTVEEDLERLADTPAWRPPGEDDGVSVSLPLLEESGAPDLSLEMQMTQSDFRP